MVSQRNEMHADLKVTGEHELTRALKNTSDSADKAGRSLEGMAKDAGFLSVAAAKAKSEIISLTAALDATGNVELLKGIRKQQSNLKIFESLSKDLAQPAEQAGQDLGAHVGRGAAKSVASAFSGAGSGLTTALIGQAILAAPLVAQALGATIAGAVLGATGVGGIIGGVVMAAGDSRVRNAAEDTASEVGKAFQSAGSEFVGPSVGALGILKSEGVSVAHELGDALKPLAPLVGPLTMGLTGFVRELMPGLSRAFEASKPFIRVFASELPELGQAMTGFFDGMTKNSRGGLIAFKNLLNITEALIKGTGEFIGWLERGYEKTVHFAAGIAKFLESIYGGMPIIGDAIEKGRVRIDDALGVLDTANDSSHDFAGNLSDVGDSASKAADDIDAMKRATDALFGVKMNILQATDRYEKSVDDLSQSLQEGKRTLDASTEAGRAHREAILDDISAIHEMRDANVDNGMAVEDANALYDKQIEQLRQTAEKLGYNKKQVDELVAAFKTLPQDVELQLRVTGLRGIIEQIQTLSGLLGSKAAANQALNGEYISGRASGGSVMAGKTYRVGETGPELVTFGSDGFVHDASASAAMMAGTANGSRGGWNGSAPTITLQYQPTGDRLLDVLMEHLIKQVRINGGDPSAFGW